METLISKRTYYWFVLLVSLSLVGCGGGGVGGGGNPGAESNNSAPIPDPAPPVIVPVQPASNYVRLQSDAGDSVGAGQTILLTSDNAPISIVATGTHIAVTVNNADNWHGDFAVANTSTQIVPGTYSNVQRYPYHDAVQGGMDWGGGGRGCNRLVGTFTVDKVSYVNKTLSALDLHFEQHCEGATPALRGEIHWIGDPATLPIGETPFGFWQPPIKITPQAINYVYLDSDANDWVGGGWKYGYTQADSVLSVTASGKVLNVTVDGDEKWVGRFQLMGAGNELQSGDAGNIGFYVSTDALGQQYVFNSQWFGEGRSCTNRTVRGWFVVDKAVYVNGVLTEVDLRFEQLCDAKNNALHGAIHWVSADTTVPPGPTNPPPAGLWRPPVGVIPATGNFAYFESDAGDRVGAGQTYLYTPLDSVFSLSATGGELTVNVQGDAPWGGGLTVMRGMGQLQPGYYPDVRRNLVHNPVKGGLSWWRSPFGCNVLYGWFAIDSVTYSNGTLTDIDLRFEQHCEGAAPALRGAIHWSSSDSTLPPGPVNPPPVGLWQPPVGVLPANGNYIYLQSEPGNYPGNGLTYLFTPADSTITPTVSGGVVSWQIQGPLHSSLGAFMTMYPRTKIDPGYYLIKDLPYQNPARGSMYWGVDSYGCGSVSSGWFVVDSVSYVNGVLASIDARFEQYCWYEPAPMHGAIHWVY